MEQTQSHKRERIAVFAFIGIIAVTGLARQVFFAESSDKTPQVCGENCHGSADVKETGSRIAKRVQRRLQASTGHRYLLADVERALAQRTELLSHTLRVDVTAEEDSSQSRSWTVSLAHYPSLVSLHTNWNGLNFSVNEPAFLQYLADGVIRGSNSVNDAEILQIHELRDVIRADVTGIARDGFDYATTKAGDDIVAALAQTQSGSIALTVPYRKAVVTLSDENGSRALTLISTGRSVFDDSTPEREANVHKALEEKVNNTIVKPGGTYSFVGTLDTPVTLEKGWKEALGLFGGGAAMTPGGGICQAATTVYRAALLAGFPIVERRNHSLYVSHYETYGVGVDATVFPGVHDLRFKNNTSDVVLFQAYTDGYDAYVNVYGVDDGRDVSMEGPYFVNTRPRPAALRPIGFNEIGWLQHITNGDGSVTSKPIIAQYSKPVPYHSLSKKYAATTLTNALHAAAPQQ